MLWVLKVLDLSLDIVLSLDLGAVVVASRRLLQRPGIGMALLAEGDSPLTVDGVQKHPAKGIVRTRLPGMAGLGGS
ncbi:hypothetical protein [Aeromonas hydrophila]|uniref:hypothetical protein n=1 Tax=Aeromonas hydrophila TaxID=644 RepID=UPI002B4A7E71|nr:hypothetical protein [Aeromonas hydrophila]